MNVSAAQVERMKSDLRRARDKGDRVAVANLEAQIKRATEVNAAK